MNPSKGKIGIFWVYHAAVLARPIEIIEGEAQGDFIDSPDSHIHVWDDPDGFSRDYPELAEMPYESVPRGRVLYEHQADRFVIYLDECLMDAESKTALKETFGLTNMDCLFRSDPHYCTDASRIDDLFS